MPTCTICGEPLDEGSRTCSVCGTRVPDPDMPMGVIVSTPAATAIRLAERAALVAGQRQCAACGRILEANYTDAFCECGAELYVEPIETRPLPVKPPPGTPVLVLVGSNKVPIQYFPLNKEAMLIGRTDPVAGVFPEIDLQAWVDSTALRKISRQHALILHTRAGNRFTLRPLPGNTGTQLEQDMVMPNQDYPLQPGNRFVLGGSVRFRFEIAD